MTGMTRDDKDDWDDWNDERSLGMNRMTRDE